ncbi:MAG: hypothetical protein HQL86_01165 [Magnetococcales bacterium]|nr:hypothetical protein [Magnetococcales bacterium]
MLSPDLPVGWLLIASLLRRNILDPAIVEPILRGDNPDSHSLEKLPAGIPLEWEE